MHSGWFDISPEGWQRLQAARPLAALIKEAVQNAFDAEVSRLDIDLQPERVCIEDDGKAGFSDPRFIYTVFLTDKRGTPGLRGRQGRGLKELLAAADEATVETIGLTVRFDGAGRTEAPSDRDRGTRLTLVRRSCEAEIEAAIEQLRLVIAPPGVTVHINGERLTEPEPFVRLGKCWLPTLDPHCSFPRIVDHETELMLFWPRGRADTPHLCELGIPVEPSRLPWHVDVGQRLPATSSFGPVDPRFRPRLLVALAEALVQTALPDAHLHDPWLIEALTSGELADGVLRAWVRRVFGERVLLTGSSADDDRVRQLGFTVLSPASLPRGLIEPLGRVLDNSSALLARQKQAAEEVRALTPQEERALGLYRHLARKIIGKPIKIRVFSRPASTEGLLENATFDRRRNEMRINLSGQIDLREPLAPRSLAVFFHELAHVYRGEHDQQFTAHLEAVSGRGAALLAAEGRALAELFAIELPPATTMAT